MKLGTKIVWGFILTNLIFIALVAAVFIFMRPVQEGSADLNEDVLPLLNQATAIQFDSAMEGSQMRAYMLTRSEAAWTAASQYSDSVVQAFQEMEDGLSKPSAESIRIPEVLDIFQTLRSDYLTYHTMALEVKGRQEAMFNARRDMMNAHAEFTNVLTKFLQMQADSQRQEVFSGSDPSNLIRRAERLAGIGTVRNYADQMALNIQRAVADGNPELFSEAKGSAQKARELLIQLDRDNRREEAKAYTKSLLALLDAVDSQVDHLIGYNAESTADAVERTQLNEKVNLYAAKLREVGNRMAVQAASDSQEAAGRVVAALLVGTLVAIAVGMLMAFFITRGITKPINIIIDTLSEGAAEVDRASGQLSQAANTLSGGATENAASLEETSAALEELSSMTSRNADNAAEANNLMTEANASVRQANASM